MAGDVTSGPKNFFTRRNQVFSFAALERPNIGFFKKSIGSGGSLQHMMAPEPDFDWYASEAKITK